MENARVKTPCLSHRVLVEQVGNLPFADRYQAFHRDDAYDSWSAQFFDSLPSTYRTRSLLCRKCMRCALSLSLLTSLVQCGRQGGPRAQMAHGLQRESVR